MKNKLFCYLCNKNTIAICFILLYSFSFAQKKVKKPLDAQTFTIELIEQGKKKAKPIADELSFKSDKFASKYMAAESQFKPAIYTATVDSTASEPTISFDFESKNTDDETLHWVGTVKGEAIEGTTTLAKKGKTKKEYAFSGTLKTKKK